MAVFMSEDELRAIVARLGVSGAAMARLVGINANHWYGYQTGRQNIPDVLAVLLRVMVHMRISPARAAELADLEIAAAPGPAVVPMVPISYQFGFPSIRFSID